MAGKKRATEALVDGHNVSDEAAVLAGAEGDGAPGVSRDERHDSIDPHTGTLTAEAVALRAERAKAAK